MSLDQFDWGLLVVVGIYVATYVIMIVRRRHASYRETQVAEASNHEGGGGY